MFYLALAFSVSFLTCFAIVKNKDLHKRFTTDPVSGSPQKFHTKPTSRVGGVGIFFGVLSSALVLCFIDRDSFANIGLLMLCSVFVFAVGLAEDITKKAGIKIRLFIPIVFAGVAYYLIDCRITEIGISFLDPIFAFIPFSFLFTVIAVSGVSHAFNIIDGQNGLSSGIAIIIISSLAYVANAIGDASLFYMLIFLLGGILGFFIFNFPYGKIFMGDGGAYFIGFIIATSSILLIKRNPDISPWFPLLLNIYPVWETLFSIYRRRLKKNLHPGEPDALHLHSLIYKRIIKRNGENTHTLNTKYNSMTSPYLWGLSLLAVIPATLFWRNENSLILILFAVFFIMIYGYIYNSIVNFRVPYFFPKKRLESNCSKTIGIDAHNSSNNRVDSK